MSLPLKMKSVELGDSTLEFRCEPCEGEYLDTSVMINGQSLCWITWNDVEKFIEEIRLPISKYSI
jgi:hypothetical protein